MTFPSSVCGLAPLRETHSFFQIIPWLQFFKSFELFHRLLRRDVDHVTQTAAPRPQPLNGEACRRQPLLEGGIGIFPPDREDPARREQVVSAARVRGVHGGAILSQLQRGITG